MNSGTFHYHPLFLKNSSVHKSGDCRHYDNERNIDNCFLRSHNATDNEHIRQGERRACEQQGHRGAFTHAGRKQSLNNRHFGQRGKLHKRTRKAGKEVRQQGVSAYRPFNPRVRDNSGNRRIVMRRAEQEACRSDNPGHNPQSFYLQYGDKRVDQPKRQYPGYIPFVSEDVIPEACGVVRSRCTPISEHKDKH